MWSTYTGHVSFLVSCAVDSPLPVGTDGVVEGEGVGEDDGDGLVRGILKPVELAVVDEHGGGEDEECVWVGVGWSEKLSGVDDCPSRSNSTVFMALSRGRTRLCSLNQRSVLSREALRQGNSAARRWLSGTRKHGRSLEVRSVTGR